MAEYRTLGEKLVPGISGAVGSLRRTLNPTAALNALSGFARSARAAFDPQEAWLQEGERQGKARAMQQAVLSRVGPPTGSSVFGTTPVVTGRTSGGEIDRTQSDTYKQYAMTPQGQFDRYFGTSEMDRYFGGASRGAGAPKSVEEMTALAGQTQAPAGTGVPLSTYYRAQSAAGRGNMPEIQKALGYAEGSDMAKWAAANPMLAQRLYAEQQAKQKQDVTTVANTGYAGVTPQPVAQENFSVAANAVPGPWNVQGAMVDANRGAQNLFSKQAEFTTGEGMPAFETTSDKVKAFLQGQRIGGVV